MKSVITPEGDILVGGLVESLQEFQTTLYSILPSPHADLHRINQPFEAGSPSAILRSNLVCEEALELGNALKNEDLHQVLKESCDLLYVLLGVVAVYNLPIFPAFERVHNNNVRKLINGSINDEGKLIKPPNHPKVDLTDLVKECEEMIAKENKDREDYRAWHLAQHKAIEDGTDVG